MATTAAGSVGRAEGAGWIAVVVVALLARVHRLGDVFLLDGVHPLDGDSAYHLRRTMAAVDGPVPTLDPLMDWPAGAICHWSPGFDWLAARFATVWPGVEPAVAACFLPVLLGLTVVLASMMWVRGRAGGAAALAAGIVLALCPQEVSIAQVGRLDHHVAEALTLLGALIVVARPAAGRRWVEEGGWFAVAWLGVWIFSGSVLYVGIAVAARLLTEIGGGRASGTRGAIGLAAAALGTAVWVRPLVAEHGEPFTFVYPSYLHPLLLAAGAGALALSGWVSGLRTAPIRVVAMAVGAGAAAGAGVLLAPGVAAGAVAGVGDFLFRADPWLAGIAEFQSPFRDVPVGDWPARWTHFAGWAGLAAVVLAPAGHLALGRTDRRAAVQAAVIVVGTVALGVLQVRFLRVALPPLLCVAGIGLVALLVRARASAWWGPAVAAPLSLGLDVTPSELAPVPVRDPTPVEEVTRALRSFPAAARAEGVLTPWDFGHFVLWHAQRPVVTTGFGSFLDAESFRRQEALWSGSASETERWMVERHLGWVLSGAFAFFDRVGVAGAARPFTRDAAGRGVLEPRWFRAIPLGALVVGGSAVEGVTVAEDAPALGFLWPRVASTRPVGGLDRVVPNAWLYERVPGVELSGALPDGTIVSATLILGTPAGAVPWVTRTVAAEGTWRLRLPIPTGIAGPVSTADRYDLRLGDVSLPLPLPEPDVRAGAKKALPPP